MLVWKVAVVFDLPPTHWQPVKWEWFRIKAIPGSASHCHSTMVLEKPAFFFISSRIAIYTYSAEL